MWLTIPYVFPSLPSSKLSVPIILLLLFVSISGSRGALAQAAALANPFPPDGQQQPLSPHTTLNNHQNAITPSNNPKPGDGGGISAPLFASLERMARLVDIAYCVGTTGISKPFSCASRCKDFPTLHLIRTWNTGILMSDSCGYIAVDHGGGKNNDDNQAATATAPPAIIVAFRGTYSITNTIVDLSTIPQEYVPYPAPGDDDGDGDDGENRCGNCTVHMGFLASWRVAREVVLPALKAARAQHPGYPVHLVGHSLGGAVAALAALELRLSLEWEDVQVTTFGEPRVGNEGLARYLDEAFGLLGGGGGDGQSLLYRRVTHVDDPVPLLPLSEWGFRSHAGEVYIGKTDLPPDLGDLRVCSGDEDVKCSAGAEVTGRGGGWLGGLLGRLRGEKKGGEGVGIYDFDGLVDEDEDEGDMEEEPEGVSSSRRVMVRGFPTRLKLWQLFFAHRDYFWRLGLCVPGGDPADWGRGRYNMSVGSYSLDMDREL